jgi:hypothetical protein
MLRQIEGTRYHTLYNGRRWPEDGIIDWPYEVNKELRQYVLDATWYLEQREVFKDLAD